MRFHGTTIAVRALPVADELVLSEVPVGRTTSGNQGGVAKRS